MAAFDGVVRKSVEALDAGLRVYGELPECRTQAEWNGWIAYEAAVNRAFANRPVVLMCGYDARVVPESRRPRRPGRRTAWCTPAACGRSAATTRSPRPLVRSLAPAFEVLPGLRSLPIGDGPLHDRLAEAAAADGVPAARAPRPAGRGGRGVLQRRAVRPWRARAARGTRRLALRLRGDGRGERVSTTRSPATCRRRRSRRSGQGSGSRAS